MLGAPGLSLSYNGYLYVHGNPVNLTDPSGQIIPIAAILLGAAAGAAISTALEVGSQLLQGRSIDCLDMGSVGRAALEGAVMGRIGGGVGAVLKTAVKAGQITRRAAAAYSAAADISTGVIWDMAVYQETPSDALVRNVAAFGVGAAASAVSERLVRSAKGVGQWLRGADDDVARAMREAGDSGGMRAARRAGAEAQVDLSQQRVWADDEVPPVPPGQLPLWQSLLEQGEGRVGTYGAMSYRNQRDQISNVVTPHHMPSDAYMKGLVEKGTYNNFNYTYDTGITMNMSISRHNQTSTINTPLPQWKRDLLPRDMLAYDVWEARTIYRAEGVYTGNIRESLRDVIKRNKKSWSIFAK